MFSVFALTQARDFSCVRYSHRVPCSLINSCRGSSALTCGKALQMLMPMSLWPGGCEKTAWARMRDCSARWFKRGRHLNQWPGLKYFPFHRLWGSPENTTVVCVGVRVCSSEDFDSRNYSKHWRYRQCQHDFLSHRVHCIVFSQHLQGYRKSIVYVIIVSFAGHVGTNKWVDLQSEAAWLKTQLAWITLNLEFATEFERITWHTFYTSLGPFDVVKKSWCCRSSRAIAAYGSSEQNPFLFVPNRRI